MNNFIERREGENKMTDNIKTEVNGTIITITIDAAKTYGQSKSGKSTVIASTHGNIMLVINGEPHKLGLNVYK